MFVFHQDVLAKVFEDQQGVDLVSYGKPRDAFVLPVDVPLWTSGYGGKYEMKHTCVPKGVMVAVGNLEDLDMTDQTKLKAQLKDIDIYPTGHSGDFSGTDLKALRKWFASRSRLDNEVNSQTPLAHAKRLTPSGLGQDKFDDLASYLADHMNLFRDPAEGTLVPSDHGERLKIVMGLLDGLSKTVRYTRLDEPAQAFQLTEQILIEKGAGSVINLSLKEPSKILLRRTYKNGESDITPLDRAMLGRTYVTADGEPLGDRGGVDVSIIALKANAFEHGSQPSVPVPYVRGPQDQVVRL